MALERRVLAPLVAVLAHRVLDDALVRRVARRVAHGDLGADAPVLAVVRVAADAAHHAVLVAPVVRVVVVAVAHEPRPVLVHVVVADHPVVVDVLAQARRRRAGKY